MFTHNFNSAVFLSISGFLGIPIDNINKIHSKTRVPRESCEVDILASEGFKLTR